MRLGEKKGGILLSYIQMISNVLVKFIYTPFLLHALGQNEYGLYSLVMSIVGYLSILDMGFGSTVTRYTVKYKEAGDKDGLYKLYSTLSLFYVIIGFIALLVCTILSFSTQALFGSTMTLDEVYKLRIMIMLVGLNLLFSFPLQISTSVIVAYEKFIFKNGVNLLKTFIQPATMILLLYLVHIKSVGAIVVVTAFNLFTYLIYYLYAVRKLDFKVSLSNIDKTMVRPLFTFSVWMFLMMVYEQLQYNSGQFILGMFQGSDVVAIWGIAMIFILNYRSLSTAISNVFIPSIMAKTFSKDRDGIKATVIQIVRLQTVILVFILINFIVFGEQFLELWAGETYIDAFKCSLIVMIPQTIALVLDFCYLLQMAENKLKYRTITIFGSFLFSFFFIYFTKGIDLETYSYVIAMSMSIGLVFFVLIYIKKYGITLSSIFGNFSKVAIPQLLFAIIPFCLRQKGLTITGHDSILEFLLEIVLFNIILVIIVWFFCLNREEKNKLAVH